MLNTKTYYNNYNQKNMDWLKKGQDDREAGQRLSTRM